MSIVVGVVIVLHGLVHLLYFGHGWKLFELQAGLAWPDGSWAFSKLLGDQAARMVASVSCILAAIAFVTAGTGVLVKQAWWRPVVVGAAIFSAALFILFWNGKPERLADQGVIALLINAAILVAVLVLRWPDFGF
jgi:hypothetical protein